MKPSGKKGIYEVMWDLESFAKKFPEGSGDRIFIEKCVSRLRFNQWLNEEQLKALYHRGWREDNWLTWLPDDFDDEY